MRQCPQCGLFEAQLAGSTHLGCAHCYVVFHDQLSPLIWNFHGSTVHQGEIQPPMWEKDQARAQVYREAIDKAKTEGRDEDADILTDLLRFLEGN